MLWIMSNFRVVLALILLAWSPPTWADPAWISSGGAVHQLTENKSVTMQSEIVNIHVSKDLVTVDCRCTFVNNGPACKIRMGFPEGRSGDGCPRFLSYESSINGKEVKTEIVRDNDPYIVWHANDIEFAAEETKIIRDTYTSIPGWFPARPFPYNCVEYVLNTASSWHGPIRKADIVFMFDKDALPQPLRAVSTVILPNGRPDYQAEIHALATPGTFVYRASKAPKINGQTVRFEFTDLYPSKKDDIALSYGHMSSSETRQFFEAIQRKYQETPVPQGRQETPAPQWRLVKPAPQ